MANIPIRHGDVHHAFAFDTLTDSGVFRVEEPRFRRYLNSLRYLANVQYDVYTRTLLQLYVDASHRGGFERRHLDIHAVLPWLNQREGVQTLSGCPCAARLARFHSRKRDNCSRNRRSGGIVYRTDDLCGCCLRS
jgi:hypothetical protein